MGNYPKAWITVEEEMLAERILVSMKEKMPVNSREE